MIVKVILDLFDLLSLLPEFAELLALLLVILFDEFIQVSDLFVEVLVNVLELGPGHF